MYVLRKMVLHINRMVYFKICFHFTFHASNILCHAPYIITEITIRYDTIRYDVKDLYWCSFRIHKCFSFLSFCFHSFLVCVLVFFFFVLSFFLFCCSQNSQIYTLHSCIHTIRNVLLFHILYIYKVFVTLCKMFSMGI